MDFGWTHGSAIRGIERGGNTDLDFIAQGSDKNTGSFGLL